jgi:hypothetical protein
VGERGRLEGCHTRALHEAAHALVGHLLGWQISWVKLYRTAEARRSGFDGGVKMLPPARAALTHRSAVRLAGEIAETLCTRRSFHQIRHDCGDDWLQLRTVDFSRSHLSRRRMDQLICQGRGLARRLIEENMESFLGLAEAVHRGPLSHKEARRVIGHAAPR